MVILLSRYSVEPASERIPLPALVPPWGGMESFNPSEAEAGIGLPFFAEKYFSEVSVTAPDSKIGSKPNIF